MSYDQFLSARRVLMADVVRRAFEQLRSAEYTTPVSEPVSADRVSVPADRGEISLFELVDNELVAPGTVLVAVLEEGEVSASVLPDGRIHCDEVTFSSLAELSDAVGLTDAPWHSWVAVLPNGRIRLAALREQLGNSTGP
jgi:hypothetical protein